MVTTFAENPTRRASISEVVASVVAAASRTGCMTVTRARDPPIGGSKSRIE